MKKIIILALTILASTAIIYSSYKIITSQTAEIQAEAGEIVKPIYIMKDYEGKLAVFNYGSSTPFEIFDVYTSDFSEADIEILTQGIEIYTSAELQSLVEDYTS